MPGYLMDVSTSVLCAHGGKALSTAPMPRVKVLGMPVVTQPVPFVVSGCANPAPAGGPCVTAQWTTGAVRVKAMGQPLLLIDSKATCAPPGAPASVIPGQTRVKGI